MSKQYQSVRLPNGQIIQIEVPMPKNFPIDAQGKTWDGRQLKFLEPLSHDTPKSKLKFWQKVFKKRRKDETSNIS